MTREGFARLAFEVHYDAGRLAGGGWDAWTAMHPEDGERARWLAVGELIEACVDGAAAGAQEPLPPPGQPEPKRYALVEQLGHRATVASIRETTFCGKPVLEVTSLHDGRVHLAAPDSLYQVTMLTEDEARERARPWTARAIAMRQAACDDDAEADDLSAGDEAGQ